MWFHAMTPFPPFAMGVVSQDLQPPQPAPLGMETQRPLTQLFSHDINPEETLIEKTLLAIQEKVKCPKHREGRKLAIKVHPSAMVP